MGQDNMVDCADAVWESELIEIRDLLRYIMLKPTLGHRKKMRRMVFPRSQLSSEFDLERFKIYWDHLLVEISSNPGLFH